MGRPRTFDWDLAEVMHREGGLNYVEVGREFGVSAETIRRALRPHVQEYQARYQREHETWKAPCVDCGGPATRTRSSSAVRHGRCRSCAAIAATKRVRPDTLCCSLCRQWLPDDVFPGGRTASRRYRSAECTLCSSERRRLSRMSGGK